MILEVRNCRGVYDSHDYHEGIHAFKEMRKPVYLGR